MPGGFTFSLTSFHILKHVSKWTDYSWNENPNLTVYPPDTVLQEDDYKMFLGDISFSVLFLILHIGRKEELFCHSLLKHEPQLYINAHVSKTQLIQCKAQWVVNNWLVNTVIYNAKNIISTENQRSRK